MTDRLTRDAWIAHGFGVLREQGHEALKADTMSKALGVSRGSFYWHFPSLGDFHAALLEAWQVQNTEKIIADLQQLPEPHLQLPALIQRSKDTPQPLEYAMRRWGGANIQVAAALAVVDEIRCTYLINLLVSLGVSAPAAKDRAIILTWAFIGNAFAPDFGDETSDTVAEDLSAIFMRLD